VSAGTTAAMRDTLLLALHRAMGRDQDIFFLTADFGSPVLDRIRADFPRRIVNLGIAEQNLINVACGLALEGFTVFAYAIAPFITMRCYEQVRVNLAMLSELRALNVNLIGVGAGYSYVVSGPTHQCYEDLTLMRALPNVQVLSPADWYVAAELLPLCLSQARPKYLRLDAQPATAIYDAERPLDLTRGFTELASGCGLCIVATGYMTRAALAAAAAATGHGRQIGVVDLFDLSRFDADALAGLLAPYPTVMTVEEGFVGRGGLDALILGLAARRGLGCRVVARGLDHRYHFALGTREAHHEQAGIGACALLDAVLALTANG
jgi:transketolase